MKISIFWFRRDLRFEDNAGFYYALRGKYSVLPLFIFDKNILDDLEDKLDKRVIFIHRYIEKLNKSLGEEGSTLLVKYGDPIQVWKDILAKYDIAEVYTNKDYEPYAKERDATIAEYLQSEGISFHSYKDQCIFEMDEVLKKDGDPYTVFTPYSKVWKEKLKSKDNDFYLKPYPTEKYLDNLFKKEDKEGIPSHKEMDFKDDEVSFPSSEVDEDILKKYSDERNLPAKKSTTRIGIHLRFGTVSIRQMAALGREKSNTWLNELIWRDFYMMILHHFPHVVDKNFHKKYDNLKWRNSEEEFEAWCNGKTGYPIVDAGMRELNETGFMHNRVRMITASFLTKHLLIDWRWGEAYFAKKLLDYELASNNGGWQWAAGTGTDAQPYFRIFNPYSQTEKFDPQKKYIKRWIPEFEKTSYPKPIVEHKEARERALRTFKKALGK